MGSPFKIFYCNIVDEIQSVTVWIQVWVVWCRRKTWHGN